jgi:hypothetical protein
MKRVLLIALSAVSSTAFIACGSGVIGESEGASIDEGSGDQSSTIAFAIKENTPSRLSGTLRTVDGLLTFTALTENAKTTVSLVVNGKSFDAVFDGSGTSVDGHDAVLTTADRAMMSTFIDQFALRLSGATAADRDASLNRLALYLSVSPDGHIHRNVTVSVDSTPSQLAASEMAAASGAGDEGTTCVTVGKTVTAVYSDRSNVVHQENIVVGSNLKPLNGGSGDYSCMGKCGVGCKDYWFIKVGYTKDCLDHDTCSRRYSASGGSSDPNCGDEYRAASGDFLGSSRCTGK